jgi:hypothetical protein
MRQFTISTRLGISLPVLCVLLLLTQSNSAASAGYQNEQQPSRVQQRPPATPEPAQNSRPAPQQTQQPDQPTSKQRKIWTNEDLVLLRTPADIYLLEKEAREALEAEAAAKLAAEQESHKAAPVEFKLPASIEETQLLIKDREEIITDALAKLTRLNFEIADTPDELREAKQKEIDTAASDLDRDHKELKALQDHLVELQKLPAGEAPPTPQPPPST